MCAVRLPRSNVMTGALATQMRRLSSDLSLSQEELAALVGTSARTVARWAAGEASPQRLARQRLLELFAVGERLKNVLKPEDANLWIFTPNRLLEYDTPAERIGKGQFRDVLALIEALAEGVVL